MLGIKHGNNYLQFLSVYHTFFLLFHRKTKLETEIEIATRKFSEVRLVAMRTF